MTLQRGYTAPERREGEHGWEWCQRYADIIPPEAIVRALVAHLLRHEELKGKPAWSVIGCITGHGSGVSSAIVEKYRSE